MAESSTAGRSERPDQAVTLDASAFGSPRPQAEARQSRDLHVCPACGAEFVYPTNWTPADRKRWSVDLRCAECEWTGGGVHEQDLLDRFDDALDRSTESIVDDLKALTHANLLEQIDAFVAALWADQILPEDF
jgi:hypothetical protein